MHYGFETSVANFLDFIDIKLEPDERRGDLYQRIGAFIENNLLKENGSSLMMVKILKLMRN